MTDGDFGKPIIAIANSYTPFVPGHVHLKDMGQLVAREIEKTGGIAMGGSTNTVLHLLAVAREAEVDFTMKDMDRLSRFVPTLCKVAPSSE